MKIKQRFIEIDVWRSLAVIAMIVFHIYYLDDYFSTGKIHMYSGFWLYLARFVQWSFLLLVGISLQLSFQKNKLQGKSKVQFIKKNYFRAFIVLLGGGLVTLTTWYFFPQQYIYFGILHFIAFSIFFLSLIANYPWICLALSILVYLESTAISQIVLTAKWTSVFGFYVPNIQSLDLFVIFPWLSIPAIGVFVGSLFYKDFQRRFKLPKFIEQSKTLAVLSLPGKRSLIMYLLHIPIISVGLFLWYWLVSV